MGRVSAFFSASLALSLFAGCTSASTPLPIDDASTGSTGEAGPLDTLDAAADAPSSGDGGTEKCVPVSAAPLDEAHHCLKPRVAVPSVCVQDPATHKGLYAICIFGPNGEAFAGAVTQPVRATSPGWTFAPGSVASALGLPSASAGDEARCFGVDAIDAGPTCP